MDEQTKLFMAEGYKRFPDDVEPVDYHPAGKITVDRGSLRYAFLEGALFAANAPSRCMEAAKEIERLRAALEEIATMPPLPDQHGDLDQYPMSVARKALDIHR